VPIAPITSGISTSLKAQIASTVQVPTNRRNKG
jgi:hypothetical protein